ncbi:EAL domain-containing protein [Propionivibrio sp.]|uniref:EAL domain-containing protein n=1 Tax=Propionivibrio sp. TaxID=2212460 RepID=UPI003BF41767
MSKQDADVKLRRAAEAKLKGRGRPSGAAVLPEDMPRLVQELQVHQIELEIQNAELQKIRSELETTLALYTELYDFAPVGYLTLTPDGLISKVNLAATTMLGVERSNLRNKRFSSFVKLEDRGRWARHLLATKEHDGLSSVDLELQRGDGGALPTGLNCMRHEAGAGDPQARPGTLHAPPVYGFRITLTDITVRKQAEKIIKAREAFKDSILNSVPAEIAVIDRHGVIQAVNERWQRFSLENGGGPGTAATRTGVGTNYLAVCQPVPGSPSAEGAANVGEGIRAVLDGIIASYSFDYTCHSALQQRWFSMVAMPLGPQAGDGAVISHTDITERKQAEEQLKLAASVFSHAREGIIIAAADGTIIDVNEAFTGITGYRRDEAVGQNPSLLSSGRQDDTFYAAMWRALVENGHWRGEVWNRRRDGELFVVMQTISAVRDAEGKTLRYVALFSDITVLKEHEKHLEHIAHHDVLTDLPNRVLLSDRLAQAMAQDIRREQRLIVAYIDLDGFKAVNDNYGHEVGDQLLVIVATRMKQSLRDGDTLARIGGDEFVAVLLDMADIAASVELLGRLLTAAAQPVHVGHLTLQVSASIGVTFYPQAEEVEPDLLLRQADQAMYEAKLSGRNRYHVFDAEMDRSVRSHHESLEHIRRALAAREFVLYYQPKVNVRNGELIGAEALIRWQHPENGLLLPAEFLPVIENHQLAVELGEWVIDSALNQMSVWQSCGLYIPVSVNIGARQLQQADFVERLRALLAAHPEVRPEDLELEVLETSALQDLPRVSKVIEACREIGVMFALDDFGTGYSSLTYLKRLAVNQLKIDQSFVRDMLDDPDDLAILEGVLNLATAFRRQVIAEGVETREHGAMLLQLGCELAQGYGIARPMPAQDLPDWAATWHPDPAWSDRSAVDRNDLPLLFASAEHRVWIVALEDYLKGQREGLLPMAIKQCRFGRWLETEGRVRPGAQAALQTIEPAHRQVHALAGELLELHARGRTAEALVRLPELHALRDALIERLNGLLSENEPQSTGLCPV